MANFEIEIKSLLGEKEQADNLVEKMRKLDPDLKVIGENKQLNHYFIGGDIHDLYDKVEHLFIDDQHDKFKMIAERGTDFSVRTRQKDDQVLLVVKAAVDGGSSSNTVSRLEFEETVALSLLELDALILSVGYEYEAKWSRERVEYAYKDINVCLDKNAGYGYLAEFETVTDDESGLDQVRANLEKLMAELEVEELSQDRLARMFAFYNENWTDYYGTDKTFVVK
ncbi:MAG: CYTH domain-containing protein [Candidatus Nomurabacteria bacterium]|nr:CYTH domain-containing protein [Candidatus Nomurabacteria bacterium]USN88217.1 MAG: CYTH domain-containing protein [Candidatus Nomurabacteria bacterium]